MNAQSVQFFSQYLLKHIAHIMMSVNIKQKRYIRNIIITVCAFACLHRVSAQGFNRDRLTMSARVSQAICMSTAKYSASKTIQAPQKDASKFPASNKAKCEILQWNKCGSRKRCTTFECPSEKGTRIVGGTDALPHEFPHQVFFKRPRFFCGGSVLNEKYVITAAHCFYRKDSSYSYTRVVAGAHNRLSISGTEQERQLKKVTIHEAYRAGPEYNDITLIEVDPPFDLTPAVQPVLLPQSNYKATGDAVVTGWGTLSPRGSTPDILQKVTVPIITNQECVDAYKGEDEVTSTMMCAGLLGVGGKDSCQGDSGGPLATKMTNGSYVLVGVVSWGTGCAEAKHPGVYTEVANFVDWIYKNADIGNQFEEAQNVTADCAK